MDLETIAEQSRQKWIHTHIEVWVNIIVGFGLAIAGNWVYLWYQGITLNFHQITGLGLFMTFLSLVRQLILRRLFEQLRVKTWIKRNRTRTMNTE